MAARAGMGRSSGGKERGDWDRIARYVQLMVLGAFDWLAELLHMTNTPLSESANNEFLSQGGANSFRGSDCKISKDKANSAIRTGIIKVREAG